MEHSEILWGLIGAIFGGGVFYATTRAEIAQLKKDINGLGVRLRDESKSNSDAFHNISLAMVVIAPVEKEKEVCDFLKR